jgi:hypothetical protein
MCVDANVTAGPCVLKPSWAVGASGGPTRGLWRVKVLMIMTIIVDNAHRRRYGKTVLMIIIFNRGEGNAYSVVLVAAQGDSDRVARTP